MPESSDAGVEPCICGGKHSFRRVDRVPSTLVKTVGQSEAPLHCTSGGRGSTEPDHAATLRLTPEDLQEAAAITAVILAEGSSDIEILRKSLASLHPSRKTIFRSLIIAN
jgi:hypothetical protein